MKGWTIRMFKRVVRMFNRVLHLPMQGPMHG
jgi:hypothetical protein